jgi:hypothetical protein
LSASFRFPNLNPAYNSPFPTSATCHTHLIFLKIMTWIFGV